MDDISKILIIADGIKTIVKEVNGKFQIQSNLDIKN